LLAKILSAGQKDTEMAGVFERRQIFKTQKYPYKSGTLHIFAAWLSRLASPLLKRAWFSQTQVQIND